MKKKSRYTKGEVNKLIDSLFHPLYRENEVFRILDGLAHGLVEQDPKMSVKKFLRYNLPDLFKKTKKRKCKR